MNKRYYVYFVMSQSWIDSIVEKDPKTPVQSQAPYEAGKSQEPNIFLSTIHAILVLYVPTNN